MIASSDESTIAASRARVPGLPARRDVRDEAYHADDCAAVGAMWRITRVDPPPPTMTIVDLGLVLGWLAGKRFLHVGTDDAPRSSAKHFLHRMAYDLLSWQAEPLRVQSVASAVAPVCIDVRDQRGHGVAQQLEMLAAAAQLQLLLLALRVVYYDADES